jgi:peptidoglycan hydrolase-like protein with peptidoglycan-binding domain
MARTGVSRIDDLLNGRSADPIGAGGDVETVGFIQDLLIGHDFRGLPGILGAGRGSFGPRTIDAVRQFQQACTLPATGTIDRPTLDALAHRPWTRPFACCGYLTLVLDLEFTGLARLVSLTSQFEGAGRFTALNRNTDKAGLSFGLIQWAQKPGRLNELLRAFQSAQPAAFVRILGGGSEAEARGLIDHTARTRGGTDDAGRTLDPRFDLIAPPWDARFIAAGSDPALQRVQFDTAIAAFRKSIARLQVFAPGIRSERGIAFMVDLANQHGDAGAESIFRKVAAPGLTEENLLAALEQESVARVHAQFGDGPEVESTQGRRRAFRTSPSLSDQALVV